MKKISLLFLDHQIPYSKTQKAISDECNLFLLDFYAGFKSLMVEEENELTNQIKSFLDRGTLLPTHFLGEILKFLLNKTENRDVLLTNFPKTTEQFLMIDKLFKDLDINIEKIWYIKQNNPEEYFKQYFQEPENKKWLDKFGEEIVEKWNSEFSKRKQFATEIQKTSKNIPWQIIEMDYNPEEIEEIIIKKINGSA